MQAKANIKKSMLGEKKNEIDESDSDEDSDAERGGGLDNVERRRDRDVDGEGGGRGCDDDVDDDDDDDNFDKYGDASVTNRSSGVPVDDGFRVNIRASMPKVRFLKKYS